MLVTRIQSWLHRQNSIVFSLYAIVAAFCTYSCMYAFRKPFAVATFSDLQFADVDYKVWLITAQVLGYTLSKFAGIKIVSEMKSGNRAISILILIGSAALSLLGFALVPAPYNIVCLFLNGLPLGMIWGLVFSYLEGRKMTEVLGAGLSVSFIFSSGMVKAVGKYLIIYGGLSEYWMPLATGMIFFMPLLLFVWLLDRLPPPTPEDNRLRTKREPMNSSQRWKLFKTFAPGLIFLIITYMALTAYRDFRDNFAAEIWKSLGYGSSAKVFIVTEIPIAIAVLVIMGSLMVIRSNSRALWINHILILAGILIVGISTFLFEQHLISAPIWMTLVGFGLYMGYVPFNSILFDRMIATFHYVSNVGFLIYLADSFGYLASVGILFYKEFGHPDMKWLDFFISMGYILTLTGSVTMVASWIYFHKKESLANYRSLNPHLAGA